MLSDGGGIGRLRMGGKSWDEFGTLGRNRTF